MKSHFSEYFNINFESIHLNNLVQLQNISVFINTHQNVISHKDHIVFTFFQLVSINPGQTYGINPSDHINIFK